MAIMFDNKYYKVIESTNDYVHHVTGVNMSVYGSQETREREKQLSEIGERVKYNIQQRLSENMINLINETNEIVPIEEITDVESFYNEHPEIKEKKELVEAIQDEGLIVSDSILKKEIDLDSLKYKDLWIELGINQELCNPINYIGEMGLTIERILNSDLTEIYNAVKEKIVSEVEDC